ncbi:MAG: ABC transporter ATP-binding protein, partial [Bacteriovoracaceae bacterium]|nr:ABC transporter ATP-binding protein [Bacteriovoracaceae bacterium]
EDAGKIHFSGYENDNRKGFIKKLGYLPEKTYLYQHLTGLEFLHYISEIFAIPKSEQSKKIAFWSERLTIDHALSKPIHTYSKGMQQRLCFVSSLLNDPEVLILDEPLSGLDPIGRKDFKQVFKELNRERGTTVFFSSHVVSDVEEICNKVLFIEKGKMIYEGAIDSLIHKNTNDLYKIKYFSNDILNVENVAGDLKDKRILDLIAKNVNIVEIEKDKPTLENIIYKIKPHE